MAYQRGAHALAIHYGYGKLRNIEHLYIVESIAYAGRFAAKEAFSKALGTGISGFNLRDVYVCPDDRGRPVFVTEGSAKTLAEKLCGNGFRVHISISHEKEYAVAYAVIEI